MKLLLALLLALFEIIAAGLEAVASTVSGILGIIRVYLHRNYDYRRWLKRDLADCNSVLELGCGSCSPILKIGYGQKTDAIDIFEPYIIKHCRAGDYRSCRLANILDMDFPHKAYDAVVILDVMEHLSRSVVEQINLIDKMEQCARKKVIMFTPNGFIENDEVDGDPWQAHVSAWEPSDWQKRGYTVRGATGLRYILGKASLPKYHPYSIFAIIAMLSQPVIFNNPKIAWHSYAVKEIR